MSYENIKVSLIALTVDIVNNCIFLDLICLLTPKFHLILGHKNLEFHILMILLHHKDNPQDNFLIILSM